MFQNLKTSFDKLKHPKKGYGIYSEYVPAGNHHMTKKERVKAAFLGQETDYVPVCMWQHVPKEFHIDHETFAKHQADFYKETDVDFMKLSADGFFNWPDPVLKTIQCADELYQIKPLGPDHPWIRNQIDRTKTVVQSLNDECYAFYLIFAPISYLRLQIGYHLMMQLIHENPDAMKYACKTIADDLKYLIDGILNESGCAGIFYSVQNAEINRFTKEEYLEWIMPAEKDLLDYANSINDMNILHFCAWEESPNRLEVWKDYHTPIVSWARHIDIFDIEKAKNHFGATVWGGFDNRLNTLLYTGTKEEIELEVKSLIQQGGKTGYIIGADCSLHNTLPTERIRWVVEAARKY